MTVQHTDAFTTGSDTELSAYGNYTKVDGTGTVEANAANDRAELQSTSDDICYRSTEAGIPTGDQRAYADCYIGSSFNSAHLAARCNTDDTANFYAVGINGTSGILYRVNSGSYGSIKTITGITNDVEQACYITAIGAGATVYIEYAIGEVAGAFEDTDANRKTAGTSGLYFFATASPTSYYADDFNIEDDPAPITADTRFTSTNSATTTHNATINATIEANDLIILTFAFSSDPGSTSFTAGWTELYNGGGSNNLCVIYKYADGSEDGATITATTTNSVKSAHCSKRYVGACDPSTQAPEIQTATGTSTTPNPPSITPAGGSRDYVILTVGAIEDWPGVSAYPTGYQYQLNDFSGGTGAGNAGVITASRAMAVSTSEDPGTYTISSSVGWTAATIAIYTANYTASSTASLLLLNSNSGGF